MESSLLDLLNIMKTDEPAVRCLGAGAGCNSIALWPLRFAYGGAGSACPRPQEQLWGMNEAARKSRAALAAALGTRLKHGLMAAPASPVADDAIPLAFEGQSGMQSICARSLRDMEFDPVSV